jgi:hypothetical protein
MCLRKGVERVSGLLDRTVVCTAYTLTYLDRWPLPCGRCSDPRNVPLKQRICVPYFMSEPPASEITAHRSAKDAIYGITAHRKRVRLGFLPYKIILLS